VDADVRYATAGVNTITIPMQYALYHEVIYDQEREREKKKWSRASLLVSRIWLNIDFV